MRAHGFLSALAGLLILVFAGCYASTEPTTAVGPDSATLRAQGTANSGPARSWFELEVTGRSGPAARTPTRNWPAGASGTFSEKVDGLSAGSSYSYRVCGADETVQDENASCAQTRTFRTPAAVKDSATASWWFGCCTSFGVAATSGPSGEHPGGHMGRAEQAPFSPISTRFTGVVTCLEVSGRTAVVGAVGHRTDSPGETTAASLVVKIIDGETEADTYADNSLSGGSTPPDCTAATFSRTLQFGTQFEFVVNDAAP